MGKPKLLIYAANPAYKDDIELRREIREVQDKVRGRFDCIVNTAVDTEVFLSSVIEEKPDFLHFCGHGAIDNTENGPVGNLILEGSDGMDETLDIVNADKIFKIFQENDIYLRCVFLNACNSLNHANVIANYVEYVIAYENEVIDSEAIAFASGFYNAFNYKNSISGAFEIALIKANGKRHLHKPRLINGNSVKGHPDKSTPSIQKRLWYLLTSLLGALFGGTLGNKTLLPGRLQLKKFFIGATIFSVVGLIANLQDIYSFIVKPSRPPVISVNVSPPSGVVPLETLFDATQSSDPGGGKLDYFWVLNKDTISTEASFKYTFKEDGSFSVQLVVRSESGEKSVKDIPITTHKMPIPPYGPEMFSLDVRMPRKYQFGDIWINGVRANQVSSSRTTRTIRIPRNEKNLYKFEIRTGNERSGERPIYISPSEEKLNLAEHF